MLHKITRRQAMLTAVLGPQDLTIYCWILVLSAEDIRLAPTQKRIKNVAVVVPGDYPWKILGWLIKDLSEYLNDDDLRVITQVVRKHDLSNYLSLSKDWGLQSMTSSDSSIAVKRAKYLLTSIAKKYLFPGDSNSRKENAICKYNNAEAQCLMMNKNGSLGRISFFDEATWEFAQGFIRDVIGESLPCTDKLMDKARHGPGSTLDTRGGQTSSFFKYSSVPYDCTEAALPYAKNLIQQDERWMNSLLTYYAHERGLLISSHFYNGRIRYTLQHGASMEEFWRSVFNVVDGNRITFVPKNALIERAIAIEPTINLMLQLGVDGYIRKNLKRFGINLDDQTRNQRLAKIGSKVSGAESFCTLDLAAASDTVSLSICRRLLSTDWYNYLVALRSPLGDLDETTYSYEKLSSMGNGYTFAIESLIFAALIVGTIKNERPYDDVNYKDFAVYGDDLIVRQKYTSPLINTLYKSGFKLNHEKSFIDGQTRESCGADWHQGKNVRPVFLTAAPENITQLWSDINVIHRYLDRHFCLDNSETCSNMRKWIPKHLTKYKGPYSDEEMATYLHVKEPLGHVCMYNNVHEYSAVVQSPYPIVAPPYYRSLWQKLMHDLRPYSANKYSWEGDRGGRRFQIISRTGMRWAVVPKTCEIWCSEYKN
jgi:hypothetical protein